MVSFTIISCIYKDELNYDYKKKVIAHLMDSNLNVVIFTNRETWGDYLENITFQFKKENLRIYSKEYYQFFAHYSGIDWDIQRLLDKREDALNQYNDYTQCIRNYILSNQKLEFMDEIIKSNPFNSDYFVWCDTIINQSELLNYTNKSKITLFLSLIHI